MLSEKKFFIYLIHLCLLCWVPHAVLASAALDRLENFFSQDETYFAEFHQVVLDEGLHVVEESFGLMWLSRPHSFRWEYREPFVQTIVSDGQSVWIYDAELEQTTISNFDDTVDRSALQIVSGLANIEQDYDLEDLGLQGKLAWVKITPLDDADSQFLTMRMGFDQDSLRVIEITDLLQYTTRLQLIDVVINSDFDERTFQFEIPQGVDLIDSREQ